MKSYRRAKLVLAVVNAAVWLAVLMIAAPAKGASLSPEQRRARAAILDVFPSEHEHAAVRVAYCESRLYRWASNGQYLGTFQMGDWERARFGHGPGTYAQARAALKYFRRSGSDWSPWSCRWAA